MSICLSYALLIGGLALSVGLAFTTMGSGMDSDDPGDFEPPRRRGHWTS